MKKDKQGAKKTGKSEASSVSFTPDREAAQSSSPLKAGLYLVSTPIGNLGDITFRALEILKSCHYIAAEDTRVTARLLSACQIQTPLKSCHAHNEADMAQKIADDIEKGAAIALVSDAGTPLMSDPGHLLAEACLRKNLPVIPIPGANALLPALQLSSLSMNEFYFAGFLPAKTGARRRKLETLKSIPATLVFYESPHRILDMLNDAKDILGNRQASLAREITKLFEESIRNTLEGLILKLTHHPLKGEMVLVIEGASAEKADMSEEEVLDLLKQAFAAGTAFREAVALVTAESNWPKRHVYNLATQIKARS